MGFLNGVTPLKPTAATSTQTQASPVGANFGLDKAAEAAKQNMQVTSPAVGSSFGLDKAAGQPMTITGNPTASTGPTIMDLNKRSDRRLMRRYIRQQRNNGDVARNVNAWEAVRNMRRAQNGGVRWDSTGHQVQRTQPSVPTVSIPQSLQYSWDSSQAGINKLNNMQSNSILNTVNGIINNGTLLNQMQTAAQNVTPIINTSSTSTRPNSTGRRTPVVPTTPVMEDENGRQYTVVNNSYIPTRTQITEQDTDYIEDENGRLYKMVNGSYVPVRRNGGILKAQQGAQIQAKNSNTPTLDAIINNPQLAEQFLSALSQQLGKEITLEDLTAAAANPEMGQQLEQLAQQMMKQSAKQGAKLEYISLLRGKCPEGQELVYFAKGGRICSACMGKKMEDGGEADYMKSFREKQRKKMNAWREGEPSRQNRDTVQVDHAMGSTYYENTRTGETFRAKNQKENEDIRRKLKRRRNYIKEAE